tara:strand:- start:8070 stop:8327 length:258 start_codon:yes stop_codon:yes gene_type:complete
MLSKIIAGFLAVVGAVSAFIAMLYMRRIDRKHAEIEILKSRQKAEIKNQKEKERVEEEITQAVAPLRDLGDSKEDRDELAKLLDE